MKYLWSFVAILMLSLVCVDHYLINDALIEFHSARNNNTEELIQAIQMHDSSRRLNTAHNIIVFQNNKIESLESRVQSLIKLDQERRSESQRLHKVLDETAMKMVDLIKDNAELQKKLDGKLKVTPKLDGWFDIIFNEGD